MFYTYILLFFIYSFIGWVMEVCLSLFNEKKFVNRGFLLGPCCPIYGWGCVLLLLLLSKYEDDIVVLFTQTFLICSLLEYITSYVMEKLFKLRWWDYSNLKFNINGRICLETMLPFSVIGVLVIKYVNPFFVGIIKSIPAVVATVVAIILVILYLIDSICSFNIVFKIKKVTKNAKKDSTEEIKKAIHKFIQNNSYFYKRMLSAFPKIDKDDIRSFIKQKKESKKRKK